MEQTLLVLQRRARVDDAALSPGLAYLHERFPTVPAWQVSAVGRKDYVTPSGVRVAPAGVLLRELV